MRRVAAIIISLGLLGSGPGVVALDSKEADPRILTPATVRLQALPLPSGTRGPQADAAATFRSRHAGQWSLTFDPRLDRPALIQGSGIPLVAGADRGSTLEMLEPRVRELIAANGSLLAPERGELILDRTSSLIRKDGRLASLRFRWVVEGVPVEQAHVFVRLNSGNVTQLGAPLVGPLTADAVPKIPADAAIGILMEYSGDGERYRLREEPQLVFQPEDASAGIDYRLVWKVTYRILGEIETWQGRIDALTGEVVGFVDVNAYGRARGAVYPRTAADLEEVSVPLAGLAVTIDGVPSITDSAGAFAYDGGLASTGLDGAFFDTDCFGCSGPAQPSFELELGAGYVDFGQDGSNEVGNGFSTPADRNTFYHLNQVRRVALEWLPDLPWLATKVDSIVNIDRACNAFYDGAVNFFRSSQVCRNTGEIADIIYHEWGHGIDDFTLLADPATGEGTADVTAFHMSHSPVIGPGYRFNGTTVRNLDSNGPRGLLTTSNIGSACPQTGFVGPLGYEVHCEGEIYGQAAWELAQSLVAKYGYHTGWRTSERLFYTSLPDAGGYLPSDASPIYAAYLNADDDDGDLGNGTPNADEIFAAFDRHGIAASAVPASTPCTRPEQPLVGVSPTCGGFDLTWNPVAGANEYKILRGELRLQQSLFPVTTLSSARTSYTDTEVAPEMDYWYVVMAVDAGGCESAIEDPVAARLDDAPILSIVAATPDDTPRGNRSGFADPGEEVDLVIELRNLGTATASSIVGTLGSPTPGVEILDGDAGWPALAPGESAAGSDTLRFRANQPENLCGGSVRFELVPSSGAGCAPDPSYFTIELGEAGVCDPTPPCFVPPTFAGLESVAPGACGETQLSWSAGESSCEDATITYNVYRGTAPGFAPSEANRVASDVTGTTFVDTLLGAAQDYFYVVRANDSRSGEEANGQALGVSSGGLPDLATPVFDGLVSAVAGETCGELRLDWAAALESCSMPVSYEIYRDRSAGFVPGPGNRVGSSLSTSFVDVTPVKGAEYTYVVRARDTAGNEGANDVRRTARSGSVDLIVAETDFDSTPDGWDRASNDTATTGWWEWGDPDLTTFQPGDCASGTRCWVTGLAELFPGGGNNDVDGGVTTLESRRYDLTGMTEPVLRYALWFTNDQGAAPGEDPLTVDVSDDGGNSWTTLETIGAGTPLDWVSREVAFPPGVAPTNNVYFRFVVGDLGDGSLVEAAIDDVAVIDRAQGCSVCPLPVAGVGTISAARSGTDVVLDWSDDPAPGERFAVYLVEGPGFSQALRIGTTPTRSFVHEGAATAPGLYGYRVTALDTCGNESDLP